MYEDEKALLTSLFERTDDGGEGHMSQADLAHVCEALSVTVTDAECAALFRKHGFEDREMPFAYFRQLMLSNPLRTLADSAPVQEGAFPPDRVADFRGKIIYHPCRTGVFTPSDFAPEAAARSATLPNVRLFLEFVYGYDGVTATSKNLFYTGSGEVAYFTAGVGVVLSRGERGRPATQSQRFFLGHNDDISSMAVLEAPVTARGVAYPARTLAPTGQVTNVQNGPTVFVWDTRTGSQEGDNVVARMDFAKDARGIQALAFSEDGKYLVCVATDNRHTVYVYDWAHERLVCEGPGYNGEPPQVTGAVWDAYGSKQFVTYGRRHAKVWTPSADMERWESRSLSFGKAAMENITSAVFLPRADPQAPAVLVCGTAAGLLYVFKDGKCVREVKAHAKGEEAAGWTGGPVLGAWSRVLVPLTRALCLPADRPQADDARRVPGVHGRQGAGPGGDGGQRRSQAGARVGWGGRRAAAMGLLGQRSQGGRPRQSGHQARQPGHGHRGPLHPSRGRVARREGHSGRHQRLQHVRGFCRRGRVRGNDG